MNILHISCSPRGRKAESDRLARKMLDHLRTREPGMTVIDRPVGGGAMPHVDEAYARALGSPGVAVSPLDEGSLALSDQLIGEVENADLLLISTPLHNFTVPSGLKAWIDHVVRAQRTFAITGEGKVGLLRDRPVLVAVSSGGRYSGEDAREPDFLTPYLTAVLRTIGLRDLTFFSVERTAFGSEALDAARGRADEVLRRHFAPVAA